MRLIDTDVIKLPKGFFEKVDNVPKFYEWLNTLPTIEAEPVKHGRWIGIDDFPHETWECDRCGKIVETDEPPHYCENCGARMDGGENDN